MSRRFWLLSLGVLETAALSCSNLFDPGRPDGFDGWFHLDRGPDRATNIQFDDGAVFHIRDFGCANQDVLDTTWADSGNDALVVTGLAGPPRFTSDGAGNLVASPTVFTFDGGTETWNPGARCFLCAPDGGVYDCETPAVQDAGP